MRMLKIAMALAVVGMAMPMALAQDAKKEERKTESGKEGEAKPGEGKAGAKFDRGDEKAEKLLMRAYKRVYSAEEKGLKKLHSTADISVDVSAFGMGEFPFAGDLFWKSGGKATWESTDEEGDAGPENPLGNVSAIAKGLFEPYLAYVTGFEDWDVRFKEANFKFGDTVMKIEGEGEDAKEKEIGKTIVVTYGDETRKPDTFSVVENKVTSISHDAEMQGQQARVTFSFEFEDKGTFLRVTAITGSTEVDMAGMPGQEPDPKNPVPRGSTREELKGTIKVTKFGKAGDYELATELEGGMSLMGMNFPAKLKLADIKINDDVKDADFPSEAAPEGEKGTDDEF